MNSMRWPIWAIAVLAVPALADWSEKYEPPQCESVSLKNGDGRLVCSPSPTVEKLPVSVRGVEVSGAKIAVTLAVANRNSYPVKVEKLMAEFNPNGEEAFYCAEHVEIQLLPNQVKGHIFRCRKHLYPPATVGPETEVSVSATPWR
jgi:hypothetical protein